jgi:hypothetical protein
MTVDELTRPLTIEECRDAIYAVLASKGTDVTAWKPGAVVRTIVYALALLAAAFSRLQAMLARSAFLDTATGAWLTLVARHVYGVERLEGAFATGVVVVDNGGGGVYSGDPGDLVFLGTNGKEYRNTDPFLIPALTTDIELPVRAVEIGSESSAPPNTITSLSTPLIAVTCTNPLAVVGVDPELDPALRARCRNRLGVLSPNGPKDAYRFVATTATRIDGSDVGVTRVHTVADGFGVIQVYVASATGEVLGDATDPATDLGAVALAIHESAEPQAVDAQVQSAVPVVIPVTYEAWVRATSLSDTQLEDLIALRLAAWMATVPIGGQVLPGDPGRVYVTAVQSAIARSFDEPPIRVEVAAPAADLDLAANEAPTLGTVTATIHQIAEVAGG